MRIISGNYKGKKILEPKDLNTRPLKDLTKESIFNIIKHSSKFTVELDKAHILDLFSGTGSFGLECLSRGAKFVTFVENYKSILPILKRNLAGLKELQNFKIVEEDILKEIEQIDFEKSFDIIFMDPPYKEKNIEVLINQIMLKKILKKEGILIIHRHKKQNDIFPKSIEIIEQKKYGISKIIFGGYSK